MKRPLLALALLVLAAPAWAIKRTASVAASTFTQVQADDLYINDDTDTTDTGSRHTFSGNVQVNGGVLGSGVLQVTGDSTLKKLAATQAEVSGGILGSGVLQVTGESTLKKVNATTLEVSGGYAGTGAITTSAGVQGTSIVLTLGALESGTTFTVKASTIQANATRFEVWGSTLVAVGGRVGIGNTNPTTRLHIGAGTDAPSDGAALIPVIISADSAVLSIRDNDDNQELYLDAGSVISSIRSRTDQPLRMGTNDNDGLFVIGANTNKGRIGIGLGIDNVADARLQIALGGTDTYSLIVSSADKTTTHLSVDNAGKVTTSSAVIAGLTISTEAAGLAGIAVTALCPAGTFVLGGGCNCTEGTTPTDYRSEPNNLTAGGQATGWTCEQNGSVGGLCAARAICSRLQ